MIEIRYNGQLIQLANGTKIRIRKNNPFFAKSVAPAAYSFPFKIPSTKQNDSLFSFLRFRDSQYNAKAKIDVVLRFGVNDVNGQLVFHSWKDDYEVNFQAESTALRQYVSNQLNTVDYGGAITIAENYKYWCGKAFKTADEGYLEVEVNGYTYTQNFTLRLYETVALLAAQVNADSANNNAYAHNSEEWLLIRHKNKGSLTTHAVTPDWGGNLAFNHYSHTPDSSEDVNLRYHMNRVSDGVTLPQPYTFFMVLNESLYSNEIGGWSKFQNQSVYHYPSGIVDPALPSTRNYGFTGESAATPFPKLYNLIVKIIENSGYSLIDEFFDDDLKKLCLYTNKALEKHHEEGTSGNESIWVDFSTNDFYINDFLPDVSIDEFLTGLRDLFGLTLFPNEIDKTITIKAVKEFIAPSRKLNWSDKLKLVKLEELPKHGYSLSYQFDSTDSFISEKVIELDGLILDTPVQHKDDLPTGYGADDSAYVVYVQDENNYYKWLYNTDSSTGKWVHVATKLNALTSDDSSWKYNSIISTLVLQKGIKDYPLNTTLRDFSAPRTETRAKSALNGSNSQITQPRLLFDYGLQPTDYTYPADLSKYKSYYGSPYHLNDEGTQVGNYSLAFEGDYGLYEIFWKDVLNKLMYSRKFEFQSFLQIDELVNFDFNYTILANGKEYIVYALDYEIEVGKTMLNQTVEAYEF